MSDFKSFNFKLVVIDELLKTGNFKKELAQLKSKYWSSSYEDDTPIAEILNFFQELIIPSKLLKDIRALKIDAGNEIYTLLIPNWDGELELFDIDTIEDIVLLPNLEEYLELSMANVKNHNILLELKLLKKAVFDSPEPTLRKKLIREGISLEW